MHNGAGSRGTSSANSSPPRKRANWPTLPPPKRRLWARREQDIYDSNVGGTKNLLDAAKRAGVEQLIYTSTVATIAVDRPQHPNEFTDARLEEMVGHYKRSKWLAEKEALSAAKNGLPVIVARPPTPLGPWDWKPPPTGKIILDFLK